MKLLSVGNTVSGNMIVNEVATEEGKSKIIRGTIGNITVMLRISEEDLNKVIQKYDMNINSVIPFKGTVDEAKKTLVITSEVQ